MAGASSNTSSTPAVGIIMGSRSDWPIMTRAAEILDKLGVAYETKIVSAHRTPDRLYEYAKSAKSRGLKVVIAGAGGAADDRLINTLPKSAGPHEGLVVKTRRQKVGQPVVDRQRVGQAALGCIEVARGAFWRQEKCSRDEHGVSVDHHFPDDCSRRIHVLSEAEMKRLGMHSLLSVGNGSEQASKLEGNDNARDDDDCRDCCCRGDCCGVPWVCCDSQCAKFHDRQKASAASE
mgnify:CR=1 FL=1